MDPSNLIPLVEQSEFYVTANLEGITHEESLRDGPNGGNPLNWIFGHILYWRNTILELAGGARVWKDGYGEGYRGHPGERRPLDFKPGDAFQLDELVADFQRTQRELLSALRQLASRSESTTSEEIQQVGSLLLHEVYHAGQLGLHRRLLKGDGAI